MEKLERTKYVVLGLVIGGAGVFGIWNVVQAVKKGEILISNDEGTGEDWAVGADGWEAIAFWAEVVMAGGLALGAILVGILMVIVALFAKHPYRSITGTAQKGESDSLARV